MEKTVTFKVDDVKLFDALHAMKGETSALGDRLVSTLLLGRADWRDELGLAAYGVTVEALPSPPTKD